MLDQVAVVLALHLVLYLPHVEAVQDPGNRRIDEIFELPPEERGEVGGSPEVLTQEHSLPVLEAAHIRPYARGGDHDVANGLVLRTDLHRLFDRGYVTVDDDSRFVVSRRLRADFDNGRSYYELHGRPVHVPAPAWHRPSAAALEWHRGQVFLG